MKIAGRSLETIEKQLDESIEILESRSPAIVFLDNFGFLNITVDDEDRKRFIDKVFTSKHSFSFKKASNNLATKT